MEIEIKGNMFQIEKDISDLLKKHKVLSKEKDIIHDFVKKTNNYTTSLYDFERKSKNEKWTREHSQKIFNNIQDEIVSSAYFVQANLSSRIIKKELRGIFRKMAGKYIYKSEMLKRAYEKPRGYPGDYLIFERLYDSKPISQNIGYYFDVWVLQHFLTRGILYRKNKMKEFLTKFIENEKKSGHEEIKIMNIGCGSCREVRELLSENGRFGIKASFFCLDQDEEPLKFAQDSIVKNRDAKVAFLKNDILSMIGLKKKNIKISFVNFMYSMGVVDYFMKTTLEYFIKSCHDLLKPNGKLVIPFCSSYDPTLYTYLTWLCEWDFYTYSPDYIKNFLVKNLHLTKVEIIWDRPQPIFFAIIRK